MIFQDLNKGISALTPNLWKELFKMHELTQIMRQKDDIELLNRLRFNNLNDNDLAILDTRMVSVDDQSHKKKTVLIYLYKMILLTNLTINS